MPPPPKSSPTTIRLQVNLGSCRRLAAELAQQEREVPPSRSPAPRGGLHSCSRACALPDLHGCRPASQLAAAWAEPPSCCQLPTRFVILAGRSCQLCRRVPGNVIGMQVDQASR